MPSEGGGDRSADETAGVSNYESYLLLDCVFGGDDKVPFISAGGGL